MNIFINQLDKTMKKSLLNIAVTMALASTVFSGTVLSTQAYADNLNSDVQSSAEPVITDNNNSNDNTTETYLLPGMGAGAAAGAVVAGPVGFIVGGLIGAIVGVNQDVNTETESIPALAENTAEEAAVSDSTQNHSESDSLTETTEQKTTQHSIQVAQLGLMPVIADDAIRSQQDILMDILTTDLSLDIYFRSGSTDIESFYPARLAAIAELMKTMDELELYLDGYSDRRGDKTKNITLAKERIEKVREQLINAGVNENRIISKAFGEMRMVSSAGDLEGYTFDRKVVIRFERSNADSISSMTTALSASKTVMKTEDATVAGKDVMQNNEGTAPVVADVSTRF
jgi:sortase system peptidoglycan-associated protein